MFPKGTELYEIPNVHIADAIAIKSPDGHFVRANFSSKYSGANNRSPAEEPTSNLSESANDERLPWLLISITATFILIVGRYLLLRIKHK
ncbi:hypothetical protein [Paenibacillus pini]|uniref:Uncharacterized protein n=1 Tax=Paenibacillus pini JCM 16418 TaxID=1236976 RepID=W7YGP2_9BACL|nr:hypothetical protein [Paenibacillus pini]GAF07632.1 hypothetical protein JCM16418_1660 [Paenibacillus pini JCM 16418]